MTAAELARIYGVSIRTIRRWAAEDHWPNHRGKRGRYRLADAQRSHDKRHVKRSAAQLAQQLRA